MQKVLLVDDDHEDAVILKLGLEEANLDITIMHASDACTMFDLLKADRPAIIFMDLHMPCEDGLTCLESIRSNPLYADIPIVIYSVNDNKETIKQAFAKGADFYLPKLPSIKMLSKELQQLFKKDFTTLRSI